MSIQDCINQILNSAIDKHPIVAWVGHDGNPKEKCCLIGARTHNEALLLLKANDKFNSESAKVKRVKFGDWYYKNQKMPSINSNSSDKALYYYLIT